jgi:hypothetical protein
MAHPSRRISSRADGASVTETLGPEDKRHALYLPPESRIAKAGNDEFIRA